VALRVKPSDETRALAYFGDTTMRIEIDARDLDMIIDAVRAAAEEPECSTYECGECGEEEDHEVAFQFPASSRGAAREILHKLGRFATASKITLEGT